MSRSKLAVAAALAAATALTAPVALARPAATTSRGPSTTTDPYVIPVADGVSIRSLLTVGDDGSASNGYEMVGIPDGLGALDGRGRTFSVFENQELGGAAGIPRRHGQPGAFVARYEVDAATGEVTAGRDLIDPGVRFYDYATGEYTTTPPAGEPTSFNRFCSGSLTQPGDLFDRRTGRGYRGPLWFANEENGDIGRDFGVTGRGTAQQLPRLGRHSYENTKLAGDTGTRTVLISTDDTAAGQLWVYAGAKRRTGNAFERAGLTNGVLSVIRVAEKVGGKRPATDAEFRATYGTGHAAPVDLTQTDWDQPGADQNADAAKRGLSLNRIEDAGWDPSNPNDLYLLTTEGGDKTPPPGGNPNDAARDGGGLWRLSLEDREHPELGGTLTLLLDGSEAPYLNKPDNLDIDRRGNLLIQEDPGGNAHVARIVAYDIDSGRRGVVATFDPALFAPATPGGSDAAMTTDEESSGIIDASEVLGKGAFLFDAQVHLKHPNPEYVEHGQLLSMRVSDWRAVYGG